MTISWGKLGCKGTSKIFHFSTSEEASSEAEKMMKRKERAGYVFDTGATTKQTRKSSLKRTSSGESKERGKAAALDVLASLREGSTYKETISQKKPRLVEVLHNEDITPWLIRQGTLCVHNNLINNCIRHPYGTLLLGLDSGHEMAVQF